MGICFFLLIALVELPYEYYTFLRIIVTFSALLFSIKYFSFNKSKEGILYIVIAILFNPILPFYLSKYVWTILDLMAASIFCWLSPYRKSK